MAVCRWLAIEGKGRDRIAMDLKAIFVKLTCRDDLSRDEARWVFERIIRGEMEPATVAAWLAAITVKGECIDELVGAAEAMRTAALPVRCPPGAIDTCGTGGDGMSTFNVSTTAAIVVAAAGVPVAKHGNRSTTRSSGSTEALEELGIDVEADVTVVERSLREVGIGYLNARQLHPAMRQAAPIRAAIPVRTIFNLLGPLTNPAGVKRQLVGVPSVDLVAKIATVLAGLGAVHVWVVHGADGLCDLSITGESQVVEFQNGTSRSFTVAPEDVGLARGPLAALAVESPRDSAARIWGILSGERGACRDHTLLNAGAGLVVAGRAPSLAEGVELARHAIETGAAMKTLEHWRAIAAPRIARSSKTGIDT